MERKVSVVKDSEGKKVAFIHDVIFKGKRSIDWVDVEKYLKHYVGELFYVAQMQKLKQMPHKVYRKC